MSEFDNPIVTLSDYSFRVSIPEPLAGLLTRIADAGNAGVSYIRLVAEGYKPTDEAIQELMDLGAMIGSTQRQEPDWKGEQPTGIIHLHYNGWFFHVGRTPFKNTELGAPK